MDCCLALRTAVVLCSLFLFFPELDAQRFYGVAYSPYRQYGACPTESEITQDHNIAKLHTSRIRMYSTECHKLNDIALTAATNENCEVLMGLWIDNNDHRNRQEVSDLLIYLKKYPHAKLIGIAVGNEVLFRRSMSPGVLAGLIWDVKDKVRALGRQLGSSVLQNVPVFSVDVIPHPAVVGVSDAVGVNIHPYYQTDLPQNPDPYVMAENALGSAIKQITTFQKLYSGKEVIVTETGWPSQSAAHERQRGNFQVAQLYREKFSSWADGIGLKYFIFELVDSPWKQAQYPHEPPEMHEFHWGIYTVSRVYKSY